MSQPKSSEAANEASAKRLTLRAAMRAPEPLVAVGAHDAMSAKLVDAYGFGAVWVSGLGVSTMAYAIPDINLITMSEALAAARRIDGATKLPVIADCDNGYGGIVNVVRTVQEYERAGIAGICIEDNEFPKRNSLLASDDGRSLVSMGEQASRITAAKSAQWGEEFVVIARVEALIAGMGVDAAIERARAYSEAGADAILIHSKDPTRQEIDEFLDLWDGDVPLVAVPTLFPSFTVEQLHDRGIQVVIFANQTMRASVGAMEKTLEALRDARAASAVDETIASVDHVFELVGMQEAIKLDMER